MMEPAVLGGWGWNDFAVNESLAMDGAVADSVQKNIYC
jgi:hypothetical protein